MAHTGIMQARAEARSKYKVKGKKHFSWNMI